MKKLVSVKASIFTSMVEKTRARTRSIIGGTTLTIIAAAILVSGVSLYSIETLVAVVNRLTRPPSPRDYVNSDPRLTQDQKLMYTLTHVGGPTAVAAVQCVTSRNDTRFVPVLIEMMIANESEQKFAGAGPGVHNAALEKLTGQNFRREAEEKQQIAGFWSRWYQQSDFRAPVGFAGWKGNLLSTFNPLFGELLRDGRAHRIRIEEIRFAGMRRNGTPALVDPTIVSSDNAKPLLPDDPVLGIRIGGRSRAYPLRIVDWHRVVNDRIDGIPIAITRCTLTGAAVCFDRRTPTESTKTFHASGLHYRGNELLYDAETKSLWHQMSGEAVVGDASESDLQLTSVPVVLTSWHEWSRRHPDTGVLSLETGFAQFFDYTPGAAHGRYFAAEWDVPVEQIYSRDLLPAKSLVFGLKTRSAGQTKAYPWEVVASSKIINDSVDEEPIVLIAGDELIVNYRRRQDAPGGTRLDRMENSQLVKYLAGGEVRAYARLDHRFQQSDSPDYVIDEIGQCWQVTEEALVADGNRSLPRLQGFLSYWFGWTELHPNTEIWDANRALK